MPHYLDRHDSVDVAPAELAQLHLADLAVQDRYGVEFLTYWYDYKRQTANCLVQAPDPETAVEVHAEAHGAIPSAIIEVDINEVFGLLGRVTDPDGDDPIDEPAVRTIVFTDIVGSTEMIDRHGDAFGMELVRTHDELVRSALRTNHGREVKHTGDGLMLAFDSSTGAVSCAVDVQRRLAGRDSDPPLVVRIGINTGEPVTKGADLFGAAVNLAARLCDRAEGGGILASNAVRSDATEDGFRFGEPQAVELKGFTKPVLACPVLWEAPDRPRRRATAT
ncbi:MAG TPA: nickel-binding protein [Acidimicrobiia bacterium]|nr:nickel-binding protein [Acidimicrobiia bacterium]